MNAKKSERVQVWISKEARQALRLLAVREERELMEQLSLCVGAYEALQEAAVRQGMTVEQLIDELVKAASTPPEAQPRRKPDAS